MSMWLAVDADGIRGYFIAVRPNGTLGTGITSGEITVTVVAPDTTTTTTATATETAGKAGLYTFLVASSFLTTNGVGNYAVVMEVDAVPPGIRLRDAGMAIVQVSMNDFDSLAADIGAISGASATHLNVAYDSTTTTINFQAWLERSGASVTSPTATTITWYDTDSTVLFTVTETDAIATQDPDAGGVYWFTRVQALADDVVYYVDVSITDATGTVVTRIGVETIANP
jgi:hypothetical protein